MNLYLDSQDKLIEFIDPDLAPYEGVVAFDANLTTANLLRAYHRGIFPWPFDEYVVPWFCPELRAILDFKNLHIPQRLERVRRQNKFHFTIDKAFADVIECCATVERKDQSGTWITRRMITAYCELHRLGHAHSVEAWDGEMLVGGLYGVDAGGAFAGESMFAYRSNVSKLALLFLIDHLQQRGLDWIDVQVMTPHIEALGAKEIDRAEFLEKLSLTQQRNLVLFPTT
jgi:leucyl/phenylalanyl-tRNA--protein transferase